MAWSVLQSNSATIGSGSCAVTFTTANLSAGTKIIVWVEHSTSSNLSTSVTSVKDGALNTWTQLAVEPAVANGAIFLFALDTPAGDVGTKPTITAAVNATNDFGSTILVQEVSGLLAGNTSAMLDGTPGLATGTASPATTGALSTAVANEYLTVAYGDPGDSVTVTTPGGWTADANNVAASTTADLAVFDKNSTGGAESVSLTLTGSPVDGWVTILAAFKLAAPAGGAGPSPARPGKTWLRRFKHRQILPAVPQGAITLFGDGTVIAGTGSLAAVVTEAPIAAAAGAGSVTATVVQIATASLAGAGAVSAVATQTVTATAAGAGTVTDVVTQIVTATLTGAGVVNATGPATAAIAGAGAVTDVVTQAVIATAAGAGSISTAVTQTATASFAGAAAVTAKVTQAAAATPAGAASVSDVATEAVIASLAGAGSVTAASSVLGGGSTATLTGAGAVSAKAVQIVTATLAGAGSVTATGTAAGTFTIGTLTAAASSSTLTAAGTSATLTAAGATTATLTATDARTGGPGG